MCGIAGLFHYDDPQRPVDESVLLRMTRSLAHRGPDGEGAWCGPGVGFGHRRLAILDTSERGRQPMESPDGLAVITFNGEIYNFRELRGELESFGHRFITGTDTEVILAGFRTWGDRVVARLSGIFAFALWDAASRRLLLARDALGVKPLFYSEQDGTLRFGSEIKAILSDPSVRRALDGEAIDAYFTFGYMPAPATGLAGVRQLLPGEYAWVDARGMRLHGFWNVPYDPQPRDVDFPAAREEFTALLDEVTAAQMVSDVSLGAFLSGGLDSAAIVRSMVRSKLSPRVQAFTVGFDDQSYDERATARQTAAALGVELSEQTVSLAAPETLLRIARHVEEPTSDSSMLAVWWLCKGAREHFTVAMSGDGADEILAGYDTYRATAMAAHYRRIPAWLRHNVIRPIVRCVPPADRKYSLRQVAERFCTAAELGPRRDHAAWRQMFSDEQKQQVYSAEFWHRASALRPIDLYAWHIRQVPPTREPLAGLLHADTAFYLPNDMLIKVDRMSMAHGLEVRVPFLDTKLVRFAANLPAEFKLRRGKVRKHILRESLRETLPSDVLRRRKSGFNVPLEAWMRGPLRELLSDAIATQRDQVGRFFDLAALTRFSDDHVKRRADHAHALFAVLMFALWLDNLQNAWREPPVQAIPALARSGATE